MAVYALILKYGSFTAAARVLGVPKVAVSRAISSLERRLGVRLLERTTRRFTMTAAGELLRPYCERLLFEADSVVRAFAPLPAAQPGLRIVTDGGYGRLLVAPLVPRFMEHYAGTPLQIGQVESLPAQSSPDWDLLICNGRPPGEALALTPLGNPPLVLCATPAYLRAHGTPTHPDELIRHTVLLCGADADSDRLRLRHGERRVELEVLPQLRINDPAVVHASTAAGLGIGILPEFLCRQGLAMGKLTRVLPYWHTAEPLQLFAVCDVRRAGDERITHFVKFLLANLAPVLGAEGQI